nr:hypothetical protein Iba_chr02eCG8290 [Ipomoea batatas]
MVFSSLRGFELGSRSPVREYVEVGSGGGRGGSLVKIGSIMDLRKMSLSVSSSGYPEYTQIHRMVCLRMGVIRRGTHFMVALPITVIVSWSSPKGADNRMGIKLGGGQCDPYNDKGGEGPLNSHNTEKGVMYGIETCARDDYRARYPTDLTDEESSRKLCAGAHVGPLGRLGSGVFSVHNVLQLFGHSFWPMMLGGGLCESYILSGFVAQHIRKKEYSISATLGFTRSPSPFALTGIIARRRGHREESFEFRGVNHHRQNARRCWECAIHQTD